MFNSLLSMFACNRPKLAKYKDEQGPKITCPVHSDLNITQLCLATDCLSPYICPKCKPGHPKLHSKHFRAIKDVYNDPLIVDFQKSRRSVFQPILAESKVKHQQMTKILSGIEHEVPAKAKIIRSNTDTWLQEIKENYDASQTNLRRYNTLKSIALDQEKLSSEQIKQTVTSYKTLRRSLTAIQTEQQSTIKKLKQDSRSALAKVSTVNRKRHKADLRRLEYNKATNFLSLKSIKPFIIAKENIVEMTAAAYIPGLGLLITAISTKTSYYINTIDISTNQIIHRFDTNNQISQMLWIKQKNWLVLGSFDGRITIVSVVGHNPRFRVIKQLKAHFREVNCFRYIEEEDMLVSSGPDPFVVIWSLKNCKKCGVIFVKQGDNEFRGWICYIPGLKLLGFRIDSKNIVFYHLMTRTVAFQMLIQNGYYFIEKACFQYLPKRNLLITAVGGQDIKMWTVDRLKRGITLYRTIQAQNFYIRGIIPNQDESQLLIACDTDHVEVYSFEGVETERYRLDEETGYIGKLLLLESFRRVFVYQDKAKIGAVMQF